MEERKDEIHVTEARQIGSKCTAETKSKHVSVYTSVLSKTSARQFKKLSSGLNIRSESTALID